MADLSDKARSIMAFAAYHSLTSGEVVREDGKGHKADQEGVEELASAGHIEADGDRERLTKSGNDHLGSILAAIRQA